MAALCETLLVSRAGFYAWRQEADTARAARDRELLPVVRDVFWHHKRRYAHDGLPRSPTPGASRAASRMSQNS